MLKRSSGSARITFPAFSREELIDRLRQGADSLAGDLPLRRAILFGSWAAGRATAHSDIDLLVVYAGPTRADAHETVRRHVCVRGLEPHVYTEDDAEAIRQTLGRMMEQSVLIYPS